VDGQLPRPVAASLVAVTRPPHPPGLAPKLEPAQLPLHGFDDSAARESRYFDGADLTTVPEAEHVELLRSSCVRSNVQGVRFGHATVSDTLFDVGHPPADDLVGQGQVDGAAAGHGQVGAQVVQVAPTGDHARPAAAGRLEPVGQPERSVGLEVGVLGSPRRGTSRLAGRGGQRRRRPPLEQVRSGVRGPRR
jgi:hypothetical protein